MGVACWFKVSFVYVVCVVCLVLLQLQIDSQTRKEHRKLEQLLHFSDNKYEHACNACSFARAEWKSVPVAHRSVPIVGGVTPSQKLNSSLPVCEKLFAGEDLTDKEESWVAGINAVKDDSPKKMLLKTMNCTWVKGKLSNGFFVSAQEKAFPIAYAININKYPNQILRFLKVIYRPHNVYCVHYDIKSDPTIKQIMFNIASCLGNVIVPRKIEDVYWGWHTIEDGYFSCFSDLILARENYPWKYVITLCGKEIPLRTNAEIVALMKPLNGTSSVELVGTDGLDDSKFKWKYSLNKMNGWITKRDNPLDPIPYGMKVYKSWSYVALSYLFVKSLLCSPEGITVREYMKDIKIPEENIFAMLSMKKDMPGGFRTEQKDNIFPVTTYIWLDGDHRGLKRRLYLMLFPHTICAGIRIHGICMIGAKDLHRLSYKPGILGQQTDSYLTMKTRTEYKGKDRGPLFHNRYFMEHDRVPIVCMEAELARRNKLEYLKSQ